MAVAAVFLSIRLMGAEVKLLNAAYDVSREFYQDYNPLFARYWKEKTGDTVTINQSHGGSSKQARSIIDGLEADVATMNQATDLDALHERGNLIPKSWSSRLPYNSAPYTSTIVFLVRKGNPKGIKDWNDLVKPGVSVIVPNPKTSGNGRYSYLAAYGYALKQPGGSDTTAREFVKKLFGNVPVLDTGGRGATTTFIQRGIGDVLLTFESEVLLAIKELGADKFDQVAPSISIEAEAPVAVVDKVVERRKTRAVAQAYLEYLYSEPAQELMVKHYFRPRLESVAAAHKNRFAQIKLLTVDEVSGSWKEAQKTHFDDGGMFDQIYKLSR